MASPFGESLRENFDFIRHGLASCLASLRPRLRAFRVSAPAASGFYFARWQQ
jgi:hypothetical protein